MPTIGKSFTFEAAHRLRNHNGKCRNLHGHSYKVDVAVTGEALVDEGGASDEGMLFDFGVLSEWWKYAEEMLDHLTILQPGDPLIERLSGHTKMFVTPGWPPTAENLADFLQIGLWKWLSDNLNDTFIVSVTVWETAKSWARSG